MQMHLSFCPPLMDKGWVQRDWVDHGDVKMSCLRQRGKPCTPPHPRLGQCVNKQPVWMSVIFFCLWYFLNTQGAHLVSPGSLAHYATLVWSLSQPVQPSLAINTKDVPLCSFSKQEGGHRWVHRWSSHTLNFRMPPLGALEVQNYVLFIWLRDLETV